MALSSDLSVFEREQIQQLVAAHGTPQQVALRCRIGDEVTAALLGAIDDPVAHDCVLAERAFLATLGGGCDAPVGAYAVPVAGERALDAPAGFALEGLLAAEDGTLVIRRRAVGREPEALGTALALEILAADGAAGLVERAKS